MGERPVRVQRRRVKGWRMPENTVSVARPGRWGNPFRVGDYVMIGDAFGGRGAFRMAWTITSEAYADARYTKIETAQQAVDFYRRAMALNKPDFAAELRGKNLACFCRLDQPCHADVLLELANG